MQLRGYGVIRTGSSIPECESTRLQHRYCVFRNGCGGEDIGSTFSGRADCELLDELGSYPVASRTRFEVDR